MGLNPPTPPGWNDTAGLYICPVGTYKVALGSYDCISCGSGMLTAGTGSTSYASCCESCLFVWGGGVCCWLKG